MSTADATPPLGSPPSAPPSLGQNHLSTLTSGGVSITAQSNGQANNNASRRPPRKSTLTQQQKNQKRQRATQDQLMTLEVEFNNNPTPTATVRERIASEINMTERSVQIWFQNRFVAIDASLGLILTIGPTGAQR